VVDEHVPAPEVMCSVRTGFVVADDTSDAATVTRAPPLSIETTPAMVKAARVRRRPNSEEPDERIGSSFGRPASGVPVVASNYNAATMAGAPKFDD
jgi:hypothetical protein